MHTLTKDELKNLSVEALNRMTEEQVINVANQVINELDEYEIELLPKDVRDKLGIKRESFWGNKSTWISLIISALAMTLVQAIMGR